ncbi:4966_t:CDS:1 [Paraglomus occultum]|uniref:4966_t:CDS:1 n=1 Tax=Paraglomus occultum TaxID=144539 RepID=A0A9N8Z9Y8_9GLOM|nr:4966_t:CDS:1 [Paraglomus occultum]
MAEEKLTVPAAPARVELAPYKPTPKFVLSVRLFEIVCGLVVLITLGVTAAESKKLGEGIPNWVIYGLVLSSVSTVVSALVLFFDRSTKFALIQGLLSNIFLVAYITYTALGAVHTPAFEKCTDYAKDEENRCSAPKAAEFFSFCVVFAFGFSTFGGYFAWWDARRKKKERDAISKAETATTTVNES